MIFPRASVWCEESAEFQFMVAEHVQLHCDEGPPASTLLFFWEALGQLQLMEVDPLAQAVVEAM